MIIYMEQTIDLINQQQLVDIILSLQDKLEHVFKKSISYYKVIEK